ncbi:MAG: c-type cytochrome domain-containing protein, partial [Rhodopirellula bahusiensis]
MSQVSAVDFAHEVVPVLQRNCVHCHGGREAEGDFSLNTREAVVDSGFVDLEDAEYSHLLDVVTSSDPNLKMPPPDRPAMSEQEVGVVRE